METRSNFKKQSILVPSILFTVGILIIGVLVFHATRRAGKPSSVTPTTHITIASAALNPNYHLAAVAQMVDSMAVPNPFEIRVIDVHTGGIVLKASTRSAISIALSHDGNYLTADDFNGIKLWRIKDGTLLRTILLPQTSAKSPDQVFKVAFTQASNIVAAAGSSKLWLWTIPEGSLLHSVALPECAAPTSLAFSRNNNLVAIGCGEVNHGEKPDPSLYPILLVDVREGRIVLRLAGHVSEVTCLGFNADGTLLASGGGRSDGNLKLWHLPEGSLIDTRHIEASERLRKDGYLAAIYALDVSLDGKAIAFSGTDERINTINLSDRRPTLSIQNSTDLIRALAFGDDNVSVLALTNGGEIKQLRLSAN